MKVTENERSGKPWCLLTKPASGHSAVIFWCCTWTQLKYPGKGFFNTTLSTMSGYYLLTILWRIFLCSAPLHPCCVPDTWCWGHCLWAMYKSSNLPLVICRLWWDHPQPCLCGLGAWKVSPALFAEAPCLQPPTSLELLRGCSAASCAVPSCFPPASAPTGTGPVLKYPWTWSFLL